MTAAATSRLKIAPTSAASMTLMPTIIPASAKRTERASADIGWRVDAARAKAKKHMPMAISCPATPQQAAEKKSEFKAAAKAPSVQASGEKPRLLKNDHAPIPKMHRATGARNLANPNGPNPHRTRPLRLGAQEPQLSPREFRSSHMPLMAAGKRSQSECWTPKGPSLEKWTTPGRKLRQKSKARTPASKASVQRKSRLRADVGLRFI